MDALEKLGYERHQKDNLISWVKDKWSDTRACIEYKGWGWRKFRPWSYEKHDLHFNNYEILAMAEIIKDMETKKVKQVDDEIICPHCDAHINVYDNCVEDFVYCPVCGGKWRESIDDDL